MRMLLFQWIQRWPKWAVLAVSLASLSVIGLGDYLTGTEIDFTLFYLIPVVVLAWSIGRRAGILTSTLCALVWAAVDFFGRSEAHLASILWNISIQFGVFVAFAYALSRIRVGIVEQRRLNRELQAALEEVKKLSGLLPICAWCKKIRDESGSWVQFELFVISHSEADFTHSICPDCARRVERGG
jgi:glucose-6-phosphate-specific signal transduction histidine kinase